MGFVPLAEAALDNPDGVLDLLDELEPIRDLGPVALPEVVRALSENLGTLRREPKGNRYGRVFVGSIEEARGLVFQLVFIPGLCEGTFPKPLFDDPLLPGNLAELEARERLLLRQACATATERDRPVMAADRTRLGTRARSLFLCARSCAGLHGRSPGSARHRTRPPKGHRNPHRLAGAARPAQRH